MFDLGQVEGENGGWKPLRAGLDIAVNLVKVSFLEKKDGTITDDLSFSFKGTAPGNTGTFDFIIWASKFDPAAEFFDEKQAGWAQSGIKHMLAGYLTEEECATVTGTTWKEFATKIVEILTPEKIARPTFLKVILKTDKQGKDQNTFPMFPDFLRTDLTPDRSFALSTKINPNTGLPYERITPASAAPKPTPASSDADLFGGEAPAPAFG